MIRDPSGRERFGAGVGATAARLRTGSRDPATRMSRRHDLAGAGEAGSGPYNEKVLVVDMESEGVARHCHSAGGQRWVVVRGVSDLADKQKNDDHQMVAARNAAMVVQALLPHLMT